jgi:hypothetical protein
MKGSKIAIGDTHDESESERVIFVLLFGRATKNISFQIIIELILCAWA